MFDDDVGISVNVCADQGGAEAAGEAGGLRVSMHEYFGGSVAAHLAHRQSRPVGVIPLSPVSAGDRLPWEEAAR